MTISSVMTEEKPLIEVFTLVTIFVPGRMDVKLWRAMKLPEGWKRKPYYPDSRRYNRAEFYVKGYKALARLQEDNEHMRTRLLMILEPTEGV